MEATETWKDIAGYEGLYQVSDLGNIRIMDRMRRGRVGNYYFKTGGIKKTHLNHEGYVRTGLTNSDGLSATHTVHRLVGLAFVDNPLGLPELNHINGIKTDNRAVNLEWCTASENQLHAFRTGLKENKRGVTGKGVSNSKQIEQYDKAGKLIKTWDCIYDVKRAGIVGNPTKISLVANGKLPHYKGFIWKYVPDASSLSEPLPTPSPTASKTPKLSDLAY